MLGRQLWPGFLILQTKFLRQISTQNFSNLLTIFFCQIDVEISQATLIPCMYNFLTNIQLGLVSYTPTSWLMRIWLM